VGVVGQQTNLVAVVLVGLELAQVFLLFPVLHTQ
jgi:hypothetical protein